MTGENRGTYHAGARRSSVAILLILTLLAAGAQGEGAILLRSHAESRLSCTAGALYCHCTACAVKLPAFNTFVLISSPKPTDVLYTATRTKVTIPTLKSMIAGLETKLSRCKASVSKPSERAQVRFLPCRNFVRTNAA